MLFSPGLLWIKVLQKKPSLLIKKWGLYEKKEDICQANLIVKQRRTFQGKDHIVSSPMEPWTKRVHLSASDIIQVNSALSKCIRLLMKSFIVLPCFSLSNFV